MTTATFEPASLADLDAIRGMLSAGGLPMEDIEEHVANFILARKDGATVGTVGIEYAGEAALLRSLCVAPSHRGQGLGARLLRASEAAAAARGVRVLYLLTTSAAGFLEGHGFSRAPRESAPDGIRNTAQFRTLCPAAAACLRKSLPSASATGAS